MLANAARTRRVILFDICASRSRASSSNGSLKYDIPYSPIVESVKKRIAITHGLKSRVLSDPQADTYNSTVMRIRQAIKDKNARAVLDHWQHLNRNNLWHFLGDEHMEKISELLATSFQPINGIFQTWDKETQDMVSDITARAAAAGWIDAIKMFMLLYLKRNEPDTVVNLYHKLLQTLSEREIEKVDDEKTEASFAFGDSKRAVRPGHISILLAVTTAYAMKDSFQGALDIWNATPIRFYPVASGGFFSKLNWDPALRQRVRDWVPRLDIAVQVSRPPLLSRRIVDLANNQAADTIEKLYQAVIDGLSGPDAFIAAQEAEITSTKRVAMSNIVWTSFLAGFMKCQRRDLAGKLWNDMTALGIHPGVSLWTALIDSYDSIHAVDDALASWNMMRAENVQPNALAYRAVISAHFNGRKPDTALRIFREYQREYQSTLPKDSQHDLSVHNTVLHGLLMADRTQEAKVLLRNMHDAGISPDLVSYNTFLAYYGRRGDFKELANVVNDMENAHLVGDVFSFSTILSALLKAGREDAPDIIFKLMQKQGIEPNVATYTAIIDHQMRGQDEQNVRAAMLMLQRMELNPLIHPNEVTYTSILTGLHRNQQLPVEKVQEWIKDITGRMKERGIKFGLPTYHILMKACLSNPQPDGLQAAMGYYHELRRRKHEMQNGTWYILLAGLLQREEWSIAHEVVTDMNKKY